MVHYRVHDIDMSFECDFCAKKLRSKGSWLIHRRRHLKEFIANCKLCGQGFVTNQEYENHMGSKHDVSSHICTVCGRKCCDKASLLSHMKRHEEDYGQNSNITCKLCNKTFFQERYLKTHYIRVHENGGERFICDLCGKKVNSKRSLRDHMLLHNGLKPLECPHCDKKFTLKTSLKLHIRTHTGDRPYECKECGKCFTQRSALKVHIRYHSGERPYKCSVCDNAFVSKSALTLHQKNKHRTM